MRDFFDDFVIHEPLIKHQHCCLNIYVVSRWIRAILKNWLLVKKAAQSLLYLERRYLERRYLKPSYLKPSYLERMHYALIFLANNLPFKIYRLNGQLIAQMHVFDNHLLMDGEITERRPCFTVSKIMLQCFNDILERQVFPRNVFFGKQRAF